MAIEALSPPVRKLIGSAQKLADPESVIKELVDNSLDAHATSVSVEISANTTGCIVVKDNGYGIQPGDRELACKRFCTSKLRELADLESVGGRSLGFRGEALSNITEISGSLQIISRIQGEPVAECLEVKPNGEIESRRTASHPIGTTVRVFSLFKNIPVRLRYSQTSASKCLSELYKLMRIYALVRSNVRFSLRVLNSKSTSPNFIYAPSSNGGSIHVVRQLFGNACASQCHRVSEERRGIKIDALLPTANAKASDISGIGQFISVDKRPMSPKNGPLKEIMKLATSAIAACVFGVKEPFMFLNLGCPMGSYDANVDNLKDNVIFQEPNSVVEAVKELLKAHYPAGSANGLAMHSSVHSSGTLPLVPSPAVQGIEGIDASFVTNSTVPESAVTYHAIKQSLDGFDRRKTPVYTVLSVNEEGRAGRVTGSNQFSKLLSNSRGDQESPKSESKSKTALNSWLRTNSTKANTLNSAEANRVKFKADSSSIHDSTEETETGATCNRIGIAVDPLSAHYYSRSTFDESCGRDTHSDEQAPTRSSRFGVRDGHTGKEICPTSTMPMCSQERTSTPGTSCLPRGNQFRDSDSETEEGSRRKPNRPCYSTKKMVTHSRSSGDVLQAGGETLLKQMSNKPGKASIENGPDWLIRQQPRNPGNADIRSFLLKHTQDLGQDQQPRVKSAVQSKIDTNQNVMPSLSLKYILDDNHIVGPCNLLIVRLFQDLDLLKSAMLDWSAYVQKRQVYTDYLPYPKHCSEFSDLYQILLEDNLLEDIPLRNKIFQLRENSPTPTNSH